MVQQAQQKDNLSASGQLENSYHIFQALGSIQELLHVLNRDKLKFLTSTAAYILEWLIPGVLVESVPSVYLPL